MITAHQNQIIIDDLYVSFQRDDDHRTSESDRSAEGQFQKTRC